MGATDMLNRGATNLLPEKLVREENDQITQGRDGGSRTAALVPSRCVALMPLGWECRLVILHRDSAQEC